MAEDPHPINRRPKSNPDKPLPNNFEAEKAALGAVLFDNQALDVVLQQCTPDDFFYSQHRHIVRAMLVVRRAGLPIDPVTLLAQLTKEDKLDEAGGVPYISQLTDGLPRVSNVEHYAKIVAEKASYRRVARECYDAYRRALEGTDDLGSIKKDLALASQAVRLTVNRRRGETAREFLAREIPSPEHLIEGFIPRGGSILVVAMPHHLKSWFTIGIALGATTAGTIMGKLEVPKPVRTLVASIEDPASVLQWRMRQLLQTNTFRDVDLGLLKIWARGDGPFDIMDEGTFQDFCAEVREHRADLVIADVLRRFFRGDINSPKESAALCEQFDRLRDTTGAALLVVHHENRKEADIMRAAAGSFNFPGWANVVVQFKRKSEHGSASSVEIEVDNKLAANPDPVRMSLDLTAEVALRIEALEDSEMIPEIRQRLGDTWTVRDLAEVLSVHTSNAYRRLKKLISAGIVEKVKPGKKGGDDPKTRGLARWCFVEDSSSEE